MTFMAPEHFGQVSGTWEHPPWWTNHSKLRSEEVIDALSKWTTSIEIAHFVSISFLRRSHA